MHCPFARQVRNPTHAALARESKANDVFGCITNIRQSVYWCREFIYNIKFKE
jgi:hypothetical protein